MQFMSRRSLLFVPGDSERKLAKSVDIGADAIILDLEDAVAPERKAAARESARAYLQSRGRPSRTQLWVRINALNTPEADLDLAAIVAARPDGLMIPKVDHPSELVRLSEDLSSREAHAGIAVGSTRLIPLLESPRALLTASDYLRTRLDRLSGITWGAQDLGASLGIRMLRGAEGNRHFALRSAQVHCLLVARALGVDAIDTVTPDFKDLQALLADCAQGYAGGFSGKLAIHPDQVAVINGAFMPSQPELDRARRIVAAFEAACGPGAVSLDGTMFDIVHLRAARRLLDGRETD
jgi:citrate lyase subunit beta/citryl-CoA lyase